MLGKSRSGFLLRFVKRADKNWNLGGQEEYMQIRSPFQSVVGRSQFEVWFGLGFVGLFGLGAGCYYFINFRQPADDTASRKDRRGNPEYGGGGGRRQKADRYVCR